MIVPLAFVNVTQECDFSLTMKLQPVSKHLVLTHPTTNSIISILLMAGTGNLESSVLILKRTLPQTRGGQHFPFWHCTLDESPALLCCPCLHICASLSPVLCVFVFPPLLSQCLMFTLLGRPCSCSSCSQASTLYH